GAPEPVSWPSVATNSARLTSPSMPSQLESAKESSGRSGPGVGTHAVPPAVSVTEIWTSALPEPNVIVVSSVARKLKTTGDSLPFVTVTSAGFGEVRLAVTIPSDPSFAMRHNFQPG